MKHLIANSAAWLAILGGIILLLIACMVCVSAFGRYLFNSPINGDFELVEIGAGLAIFSFLPWLMLKKGNITIEAATAKLSIQTKKRLDGGGAILFCLMYILLAIYAAGGAYEAMSYKEQSSILAIPLWPSMAYGAFCLTLSSLSCLVLLTKSNSKGR